MLWGESYLGGAKGEVGMATFLSLERGSRETVKRYYPVFRGEERKAWTARSLVALGVESVQYSLIPGLLSAEIRLIKLLPRNRVPGSFRLGGDNLCQLFRRVGGYQTFLAAGQIYHLELEFHLEQEPDPIVVHLSKPDIIASTRKISDASRKTIRRFLEHVGFCTRDELPSSIGLPAFFSWMSRVQSPTMTERDFVDVIGKPAFDALRNLHILEKYDVAKRILCNQLKGHRCEQIIIKNDNNPSYPYRARCHRLNKIIPLREMDVRRYTTLQSSFLNLLKRLFHISGTLDKRSSAVDDFGVTYLGRTKWRNRNTEVMFCHKPWSSLLPYYLLNRLGMQENTLVLAPARWIAGPELQRQYDSHSRVELLYLDEMLELKRGHLNLAIKYDHFEDQTLKLSGIPYAQVIDKHGRREVSKKEYKII